MLLYNSNGITQIPNWEWKKVWQGGMETYKSVQTADDNFIFTGSIFDSVAIDGQIYKAENGRIFNAKLNSNGNILWLKQYKDISVYFMFNGYASDPQGNVYYSINTTKPNVSLDNITLADSGNYLIKVKADGNIQWAYKTNGAIRDIAIDKDNNVFGIGAHSITNPIAYLSGKLYALLLNSNDASVIWEYVNTDAGRSHGIFTSADTLGNLFVLGVTDTDIDWNGTLLSKHSNGKNFILKINQAGNIEWHIPAHMPYTNEGYGKDYTLLADNKGGLYLAGIVQNEVYFGTQQINIDIDSKKYVFLSHIAPNGAITRYRNIMQDHSRYFDDFKMGELKIKDATLYLSHQYQDSININNEILSTKQADFSTAKNAYVLSTFDTLGNHKWSRQVFNNYNTFTFEYDFHEGDIYLIATSFTKCAFDDGEQYQRSQIPYFAKLSHTSSIPNIDEPTLLKNELFVYPNPTHNTINIEWKGNTAYEQLRIRDILGREVQHEKINTRQNNISLSLGHLPKGIYTIEISNAIQKKRTKIVVQ